jgi:hypothetical protein
MTDNRKSGLALIAGSAVIIITMTLHPSGPIAPGDIDAVARKLVLVHALALVSLPVLFLGAWGLSRRIAAGNRLALAGLVTYAFALIAVMNAAVADGLVNPGLLRKISATSPPASDVWRIVFNYNGRLDGAFGQVYAVASLAAVVLWSVAMIRSGALSRVAAVFGCVLGAAGLVAIFAGLLKSEHGFGMIVLGEAAWFVAVGATLFQAKEGDAVRIT